MKSEIKQTFIGLDLSLTATGFCRKDGDELQISTVKTTPKTAPHDLARIQHIRDKLMDMIPDGTAMVCVEDFFVPHVKAQIGAAKSLIMLGTAVRIALLERGIPFYVISPGQLKKYVSGKGNGPKGIVIREVYKRWGVEAKDDNQADACVLSYIAESISTPEQELHKYQQDVMKKIREERPRYNI